MNHVPGDFSAGSHPFIFPKCLLSVNLDITFDRCEVGIVLCGTDGDSVIFGKATCGFLYDCKSLRQDFPKDFFQRFIAILLKFV